MSHQNTRGGYYGSRGRSSRPNSGAFHHQRQEGVSRPFANDSFGSKDGMSQGGGKYSHHTSRGSGSKHLNGTPSPKFVYRQKTPAPDVIPNSPEAGDSHTVASDLVSGDDVQSFTIQSDFRTPTPDVILNSLEAGGSRMMQPECSLSSDLACGDADALSLQSDSKIPTADVIPNSSEAGGSRMMQPECSLSSDLACGDADALPLQSDSKIPTADVIPNSSEAGGSCIEQPDSRNINLDVSRIQISENPKWETEDITTVNCGISFSGKVKDEWMREEQLPPGKADTEEQAFQKKVDQNLAGIGVSGHSVQQAGVQLLDICPPKTGIPVLRPSLHATNRQKRNERKLVLEGKSGDVLRPGMVLLKNYLSISDQVKIVKACRNLGVGPGGFYQPGYRDGAKLHLNMMCLGKNWDPETGVYEDIRRIDGAKPPIIPADFSQLVNKAIQESHALIKKNSGVRNVEAILPWMSPDICIVNFYSASGKLGLHQDRDETQGSLDKGLPVVSFSVGDSAEFLYGDQRDVDKAEKVKLESGDVLIFGGKSRHIFHGVSDIIANTAPKLLMEEINFRPGRLNLTFRQY